jgi:hypothetical protein
MARFSGELAAVPHGGLFVVVPPQVAARAGVKHADRVRGTVRGVPYRSALMKYSGVFHLGVPKAALAAIGAGLGDRVTLTLEKDDAPLPGDVPPDDLLEALAARPRARAAFEALSPAHRREHVKHVLEAKRPETRARRIARTVETLAAAPVR